MKKLVRSRSGRQIYGPKWQNIEECNEIESDDGLHLAASESRNGYHSASLESTETAQASIVQPGNMTSIPASRVAAAPPTITEANIVLEPRITGQDYENQTWKGNRTGSLSDHQSAMYKAASQGDWVAAEVLLDRHPTLVSDRITENGDKALHVAVSMKREQFVRNLLKRMSPSDLASVDGHGYTACCYAAISGAVNIAEVMMKENRAAILREMDIPNGMRKQNTNLATAHDKYGMTPLHKAASRGNAEMVSYFLKYTKHEDSSEEEWLDLLLVTVRRKMYDVALQILEYDRYLAAMTNNEGVSALHLLAQQDISFSTAKESAIVETIYGTFATLKMRQIKGLMQRDLRLLAEKLWDHIQTMDQASMLQLIQNPPILHDAAKMGNAELISMLIDSYPHLIWLTDSNMYTIFHIAVIYRKENVLGLIHRLGAMKDLIATSQDENGNNILHLAAKSTPLSGSKILSQSTLNMQRELMWFKEVESIVPPSCLETRNKEGHRPRELFSKEHKTLLEMTKIWMRNTADSCMLVATIILTVVFTAAFTVPGGNNGETGFPILIKQNWFTCFVIFEAGALYFSTLSIIKFWSIVTSTFEEDLFLHILPNQLRWGLTGLFSSLLGTVTAFASAYFLVFLEERARLVKFVILLTYVMLVIAICAEFFMIWLNTSFLYNMSRPSRYMRSLFSWVG